jgi:hypothetical protein
MFGWFRNIRIAVVFEIKIAMVYLNIFFVPRNSVNNSYFAILSERWNNYFFLNFITIQNIKIQIIFLPFKITSSLYYPHANLKITIFSSSSFIILRSFIFTFFLDDPNIHKKIVRLFFPLE